MTALSAYYFGYTIGGGHFMHDTHLELVRDSVVPWKGGVDAQLQPGCKTFDEAVEQARANFPGIVARMESAGRLQEFEPPSRCDAEPT